jgi:hypothetical protein
MFVERLGHLLFKRIGFPFFYVLILVCPLSVVAFLFVEKQSVDMLAEQLETCKLKAKTAVQRKERKELFVKRHVGSDPYFLSKELENLSFLGNEKGELKNWLNHPAVSNKAPILQRLKFLENGSNRLVFQEEDLQLSKLYKETLEKQKKPVEMDQIDLKKILGTIEDLPSENPALTQRPQLLISEFSMQKKWTPLETQVFEVKIDLFKREFLSP